MMTFIRNWANKRPRTVIVVGVLIPGLLAFASVSGFNTSPHEAAMDSVCRIVSGPDSGGSGFVFYDEGDNLLVLTAGHLVSQTTECDLYFYMRHEPTGPIRGRVIALGYNHAEATNDPEVLDLAVIRVSKKEFGEGTLPPPARLAPIGTKISPNDPIFSVGSAFLQWPTAWFGSVTLINERSFWFRPDPSPGRSGSPIFDHDARHVLGVIVWNDRIYGRAVSSDAIYSFFFSRSLERLTGPDPNPP